MLSSKHCIAGKAPPCSLALDLRNTVCCGCTGNKGAADDDKCWVIPCPLLLGLPVICSMPIPAGVALLSRQIANGLATAEAGHSLTQFLVTHTAAASTKRYICSEQVLTLCAEHAFPRRRLATHFTLTQSPFALV